MTLITNDLKILSLKDLMLISKTPITKLSVGLAEK